MPTKSSLPLSGSLSPHVFLGAGQPRRRAEFASVVFRSCILSHGIPDRSPYIHTLWCFLSFSPSLSVSSPLFFVSEGSVPQNHWLPHLVICFSQCVGKAVSRMYIFKVAFS